MRLRVKTCGTGLGFIITYYAGVVYYCHHFPGTFRSRLLPIPRGSRISCKKDPFIFLTNRPTYHCLHLHSREAVVVCRKERPPGFRRHRTPGVAAAIEGN